MTSVSLIGDCVLPDTEPTLRRNNEFDCVKGEDDREGSRNFFRLSVPWQMSRDDILDIIWNDRIFPNGRDVIIFLNWVCTMAPWILVAMAAEVVLVWRPAIN